MSKWNPIDRIRKADKHDVGKWVCLIFAGLLTMIGGWFDTKVKDKQYERKMDEAIEKQAKNLLKESSTEG